MVSRRKKVSHAKEAFYIICIVIMLLVGLFSFLGPGGYLEMKKAQAELETRRKLIETLNKANEESLRTIQALREDRQAIEDYARKKGYAKKGEIIQEIPQSTSSDKPQRSDANIQSKGK